MNVDRSTGEITEQSPEIPIRAEGMSGGAKEAATLCVRASLTPWLMEHSATKAPRRESRVYFIQSGTTGPIKIGKAVNPEARMATLQAGCPATLRLIGSIPGDVVAERALHARFGADHIHGEWFTPSTSLLTYLSEVLA